MRRSLESMSRSRNLDMPKDPEGTEGYANEPKSFKEHMEDDLGEELNNLLSEIDGEIAKVNAGAETKHEQEVSDARGKAVDNFERKTEKSELNYKKPENLAEYNKQLNKIDGNVKNCLFSSFTDLRRLVGDEQYDKILDTINEDIYEGKYKDAKYENGTVYNVGPVNENGKKSISTSERNRLNNLDIVQLTNSEKLQEQMDDIDPKVMDRIGSIIDVLAITLRKDSLEYTEALGKIYQDIYDGRYKDAKFEVTSDEGSEFERGVIFF